MAEPKKRPGLLETWSQKGMSGFMKVGDKVAGAVNKVKDTAKAVGAAAKSLEDPYETEAERKIREERRKRLIENARNNVVER